MSEMNVKSIWLPSCILACAALGASTHPRLAAAGEPSPLTRVTVTTATSIAAPSTPDLCAELDEYGDPRRCEAVARDTAPWWDAEVCCDANRCTEPVRGRCATGTDRYWCESAVLYSDGALDCVYEVPFYCDLFACDGPSTITAPPLEHAICCFASGCYDHEGGPCGGDEIWCGKGISNDDGTVNCFDKPQ